MCGWNIVVQKLQSQPLFLRLVFLMFSIRNAADCFEKHKLGKATINSFSFDTLGSCVSFVNGVAFSHIGGFISGARMRCGTVQDWLAHNDIFNLELTPIANQDTNEKILSSCRRARWPMNQLTQSAKKGS
jgi:hypothetical protein